MDLNLSKWSFFFLKVRLEDGKSMAGELLTVFVLALIVLGNIQCSGVGPHIWRANEDEQKQVEVILKVV